MNKPKIINDEVYMRVFLFAFAVIIYFHKPTNIFAEDQSISINNNSAVSTSDSGDSTNDQETVKKNPDNEQKESKSDANGLISNKNEDNPPIDDKSNIKVSTIQKSQSYYIGKSKLDLNTKGFENPSGYVFMIDAWHPITKDLFSLMINPSVLSMSRKIEVPETESTSNIGSTKSITAPLYGLSLLDLITIGPSLNFNNNTLRPYVGFGYSLSLFATTYSTGDVSYVSRDFNKHLDLGAGIQSKIAEKIALNAAYSFSLKADGTTTINTLETENKESFKKIRWSAIVLDIQYMITQHTGVSLRFQYEKTRGRTNNDSGGTSMLNSTVIGISSTD